jgi:hypothetical protein
MTKSATRRAILAGWRERSFSQNAQTKSLHITNRGLAPHLALAFIFMETLDAITRDKTT